MLFVNFAGYFQTRLPTDPDPTDEPRGVSGYTFALAGEPNFDRIIRLHEPVALRKFAPEIGVFVTSVANGNNIIENHPLVGAKFDFIKEPKFWMLNYILTQNAGTEAISPFIVQITTADKGICITREDYLDPDKPDMSLYDATLEQMERRGGALGPLLDLGTFREITQCENPKQFRLRRLEQLQEATKKSKDPIEKAGLETRIAQIEWPNANNIDWENRRTKSLLFVERRNFAINGASTIEDKDQLLSGDLDQSLDWPIEFWNGVWDCDTLTGYMRGTLQIPLKLNT